MPLIKVGELLQIIKLLAYFFRLLCNLSQRIMSKYNALKALNYFVLISNSKSYFSSRF